MKTILLKLAGPLQSWGTESRFETRHTDLHPSKSAIIGLVAACFGYRRHEDEKIQRLNELDFAVRVDEQGMILRDYHIATKYKPKGEFDRTYVTNRYYLQDAVFVVALAHEDDSFIEEIYEALNRPYFQPYLGRRSLPLNADCLLGIEDGGAMDRLRSKPRQTEKGSSTQYDELQIYGDAHLMNSRQKRMRKDRVISFSQEERKFGFRAESREVARVEAVPEEDSEVTKEMSEDNDCFGKIGGEHVSFKS